MTLAKKLAYITPEEYLENEREAQVRHEYVDGSIYSMAGASVRHYRLAKRLGNNLEQFLEDSDCEVFIVDMKTKVNERIYYYPDVVVTCEKLEDTQDTINQPKLVIEILSPSTALKDRREKLLAYKAIDSLSEYAIVWQDEKRIELHRRQDETNWLTFFFTQDADEIEFASVNFQTSVAEIYRGIAFEQ